MTSSETVYNPTRYAGYYYDCEIDKYYLVTPAGYLRVCKTNPPDIITISGGFPRDPNNP